MIRVFKRTLDLAILGLLSLRAQGQTWATIHRQAGRDYPLKPDEQRLHRNMQLPDDKDLSFIIKELMDSSVAAGGEDGDLIDTIVRILKLSFPGNRMNTSALLALRESLLRPDELAKLAGREYPLICGTCEHVFVDGEMMTVGGYESRSGKMARVLYCAVCSPPTSIRCHAHTDCSSSIAILPENFRSRIVKGFECGGDGPKVGQGPVPDPLGGIGLDSMRGFSTATNQAAPRQRPPAATGRRNPFANIRLPSGVTDITTGAGAGPMPRPANPFDEEDR